MSVQYLDKTGLAHFWDKIKSYVIKENTRIPFAQVDGTSTSKIYTVTVPEITELTDGVCLYLMNGVVTSESGFTVNVNNLGAKPVYSTLSAASRATTLFNIDYTLLLVYNSHRVTGGCWDAYYGYDSNTNTIGYQLRTTSSSLPMKSITYRYRLLFTSADRAHYVPATNSSSTNATSGRAVCQDPIDPFGEIRYYGTTASVAADARPAVANLWEQYGITLGYSFNRTGAALVLTHWKPVYVKCAPQSDGSAIIDADTPYVQTLPSTEDGKIYIFLGIAYSDTQVELVMNHPVYWYKDGMIRPYTNASASGGVTSWNGQTGAVTYTAPVTSVNGQTGAVTVTEGLAPLIGTTSTITPQQVMTALGEGRDICISASYTFNGFPLSLNFTAFNRAVDTVYSGQALDVVASQTIVNYNSIPLVFMLLGGISDGSAFTWEVSLKMIPTNISDLVNDSDFVSDANYVHTDNNYTSTEKSKLAGIASGAEVNVQSDWNETNSSADDFIKNKPSIPSKTSDLTNDSDFVTSTELEEAIDSIPSGGGGGSTPTLLGSTPLKLTADTNVKLTATGSCTYTLESDTVADFDILNGTTNNATVYTEDNMYKVKASSSATAWYQAYVDIFVDGLTVGTTYNLCFDAVGCPNNSSTHTMIGHYILYDNSGSTLVTRGATDGPNLNTYAFQATTAKVKLRWYPSVNSYFVAGTSVGNVNKIYIDRENETAHTDIVNSSGSFTDSAEIGQITKGVTISASPTASVYKMPASSGGASLPLEGKNVVVFGDSLIGMYRGDTSATTHLATVTGATVYNVGFGGCRMSTHPSHGYAEFSMWALADAVATDTWTSQDQYVSQGSDYFPEQLATLKGIDFNTVDYVVIHYGTNDFGGGVAIGASSASTDHSTLCGAARYSIEKLLTAYPKLRIFISLPVYRYWESGGTITYAETYTNSQNNKLYECVEALKTVAREYNLPTIDGYYELGINKVNASTFLLDGTHHNAVGRKRFGQFIGSKIVASM